MKAPTLFILFTLSSLSGFCDSHSMVCKITRINGERETHTLSLSANGNAISLKLPAATIGANAKTVEFIPSFAVARKGDSGYFITPEGLLGEFHAENGRLITAQNRNYMPMYGMKTPTATFVAIVKSMCWRYRTAVSVTQGTYQMSQIYDFDGDLPDEDFEIEFIFLPNDAEYPQMAKVYRDWQLKRNACLPIRDRMTAQPELALAATNVEVRIRQAWKPVPSKVPLQTQLNEPPVHAAVTFERCADILREFKRQGINHAEICLVGWNRGGHDGSYPQLFPVEPTLGGEGKLRELTATANAFGFQIVPHTCFFSAYSISEDFDEEYLLKQKDGTLQIGKTAWGGGKPFRICPRRAYERYVKPNMLKLRDMGFHGLHYHDVYSIYQPQLCYDPRHPCNLGQSLTWCDQQMADTKAIMGGVQSEGPFDHFIGNLDYALYVNFYPLEANDLARQPLANRIVPLWQLVYHGIVLSNPFTGTLNATIKNRHKQLKLIEFGGRPLFVWYANFMSNNGNWMGKEDLTCATDEELCAGVAAIKRGYDDYEKLSDLQFEEMTDHRQLAEHVFMTEYSNKAKVVVNYGDLPFDFNGTKIPPNDWRRL